MDQTIKLQIKSGLTSFDGIILPDNFIEQEIKRMGIKPEEVSMLFVKEMLRRVHHY
ncbi:MAG: hypothetical protein JWN37_351 [Candidatus Nomurabacteria bacterium]|nr:hypothetical protein [Candidatus Nomurabacteria bacterium]